MYWLLQIYRCCKGWFTVSNHSSLSDGAPFKVTIFTTVLSFIAYVSCLRSNVTYLMQHLNRTDSDHS